MDCKSSANNFGLSLFTINGRNNEGRVTTYFMAVLPDETEDTFVRVLQHFKEIIPMSPAIVVLDQDAACIAAVRKVLPSSFISLDEWHLQKSQLKNAQHWCKDINWGSWVTEMSRDLYMLRHCLREDSFLKSREQFEAKYFTNFNETLPRCFNFLFHTFPELVLPLHSNRRAPFRFLCQGSGYTENSNSLYKSNIPEKRIRLSEVPIQMNEITKMKSDPSINYEIKSKHLSNKLANSSLQIPIELLRKFLKTYTKYSIEKFIQISLKNSINFVV